MPRSYKNPLPLGPLDTPPRFKSEPKASLSALSWAAERAGLSYGQFTIGLTSERQAQIQKEYEAYQRDEQEAKARRRAEREASQATTVKTVLSERPVLYADPEIIFDDTAADADYRRVAKDVEEISVPIPAILDSILPISDTEDSYPDITDPATTVPDEAVATITPSPAVEPIDVGSGKVDPTPKVANPDLSLPPAVTSIPTEDPATVATEDPIPAAEVTAEPATKAVEETGNPTATETGSVEAVETGNPAALEGAKHITSAATIETGRVATTDPIPVVEAMGMGKDFVTPEPTSTTSESGGVGEVDFKDLPSEPDSALYQTLLSKLGGDVEKTLVLVKRKWKELTRKHKKTTGIRLFHQWLSSTTHH